MSEDLSDPHAEQACLGAMMISADALADVGSQLRARDFHTPRHELIFEIIMSLYSHGHPVDVISVADELVRKDQLSQAGGADYLHVLTSIPPAAASASYYAAIVSDKATRRRVVAAARSIYDNARGTEVNDLVESARHALDDAVGVAKQPLVYAGDLIDEVIAEAERPRLVYPTPWGSMTDILGGGFRPGALYVVAARPGLGKSSLALQMATALADAGPVAFSSLEMPGKELVRRIIAQGVQMPHHLLERGQPLPELWKAKIEAWKDFAPHAVAFNDRASATGSDIRSFARAVKRPGGRLAGVVTDYLQLLSGPPGASRQEIVAENARQHKLMAMELECPVILLSQLNRNSEGRIDKRPMLSDLRESGAIEQDADVVMLIYRDPGFEQVPMGNVPLPVPLDVDVAKNRHGPTASLTLNWEGSQMRAY